MKGARACVILGLALALLVAAALAGAVCAPQPEPRSDRALAAYTTSLSGRSAGQIANAVEAARALDGAVVLPGAEFSFNRRVGPWTADRGYRRAPVSYDGELTLAVGGGVCQVSTTLYGAALVGGMEIAERHRHFWPATYARPGMDAAVAFPSIDLRFRNPLPEPVRIRAHKIGQQLVVELRSRADGKPCSVEVERTAVHRPTALVRVDPLLPRGQVVRANKGQPGVDVVVYRRRELPDGGTERSLISVDSYPTLNTILRVPPQ
jgi:vancomycin resistance protein VanW